MLTIFLFPPERSSDDGSSLSQSLEAQRLLKLASRRLARERHDSTSSVDSRSSRGEGGERKSARSNSNTSSCGGGVNRPLLGKMAAAAQEGDGSSSLLLSSWEERGRRDSLNVSVDWGVLTSNILSSSAAVNTITSTSSAKKEEVHGGEEEDDDDDDSPSTVISLPLSYSGHATTSNMDTAHSADSAPLAASSQPPSLLLSPPPQQSSSAADGTSGGGVHKLKAQPLSVETLKPVLSGSSEGKLERGVVGGSGLGTAIPAASMKGKGLLLIVASYIKHFITLGVSSSREMENSALVSYVVGKYNVLFSTPQR